MFILQEAPIDPVKAKNICRFNPANGAIVIFEGIVRADEHNGSMVSELCISPIAFRVHCRRR